MVHKTNWIPRKKGTKLAQKRAIPYPIIKEIILNCEDKKTQALIAYCYAFGCRAGELADKYVHRRTVGKKVGFYLSNGCLVSDILVKEFPPEIELMKPNFKQHLFDSNSNSIVVEKYSVFVNHDWEDWLYNIIIDWKVNGKHPNKVLFRFKHSAIRSRIDKELKKRNSVWSSHWLRHSRASHIAEMTRDPFAVKALLGHKRVETSMRYISGLKNKLYDVVKPGTTFGDYLGK